ncbi:MAG: DUF6702 family protein [Pseudomonadota bacterium]
MSYRERVLVTLVWDRISNGTKDSRVGCETFSIMSCSRTILCYLLLFLPGLLVVAPSWAHPSHESYAELEWGEQGALNVALKVIPEDLERALKLHTGESITLRDDSKTHRLLEVYLQEHFYLGRRTEPPPLTVVGIELTFRETWVYFTLRDGRSADPVLTFTVLMDTVDNQVNRARRLWQPDAPALVFRSTEPRQAIKVSQEYEPRE